MLNDSNRELGTVCLLSNKLEPSIPGAVGTAAVRRREWSRCLAGWARADRTPNSRPTAACLKQTCRSRSRAGPCRFIHRGRPEFERVGDERRNWGWGVVRAVKLAKLSAGRVSALGWGTLRGKPWGGCILVEV
eukprot:762753-Hanusia_phi.AAC.4